MKGQRRTTKKIRSVLVGDTSALISLEVGNVLEDSFQIFDYLIPKKVRKEIEDISSYGDDAAIAAEKIIDHIKTGHIKEFAVKGKDEVERILKNEKTIDIGEAESLILAKERKIGILLTDDLRSLKALKDLSNGIRIHLSVYVITRLVLERIINRSNALECLSKISEKRSWENSAIYEKAKEYIKDL